MYYLPCWCLYKYNTNNLLTQTKNKYLYLRREFMKKTILFFLALLTMLLFVFEEVAASDASGGIPLYNQQGSGTSSLGSSSLGTSGSVSESYPMGAVSLVYTGDSWQLAGNKVITRSTKKGVPTYDNSVDTFILEVKS